MEMPLVLLTRRKVNITIRMAPLVLRDMRKRQTNPLKTPAPGKNYIAIRKIPLMRRIRVNPLKTPAPGKNYIAIRKIPLVRVDLQTRRSNLQNLMMAGL